MGSTLGERNHYAAHGEDAAVDPATGAQLVGPRTGVVKVFRAREVDEVQPRREVGRGNAGAALAPL